MPWSNVFAHGFGKLFGASDNQKTNVIFVDGGKLAFQIFAEEAHQEIDFGLGTAPVFQRERIQGEVRKLQAGAGLDDFSRGFYSCAVAGYAGQVTALGPAAVAVHDYGDVLRKALQINFIERGSFLGVRGLQQFSSFH